jgi:hypothetical protein
MLTIPWQDATFHLLRHLIVKNDTGPAQYSLQFYCRSSYSHESIDIGLLFLVIRVDDWPIYASKNITTSLKLSWMLLISI